MSVDGNHVLIGAWGDDTNGVNVGQAHLFDASTGNLLQTFNDPTITSGDQFGFSVAVDGNHVLIGALLDDTNGVNVGQAHLFDATTGNLLQTFNDPTITSGDQFGYSVSVDGNHVLIGARLDDTSGLNVGQAHLFDAITGNLLHTFNDPTVTDSDQFGVSVAVDGNHVLIGVPGDDTNGNDVGQAHLFDATTGNLLHTFNDPTVMDGDFFGSLVSVDGNHVLIGVPGDDTNGNDVGQAHLFDATTGNLLHTFSDPTVTSGDLFGSSVSVDGNHVLIGARFDDTSGSEVGQAYLFDIRVPEPGTGGLLVGMALVVSGCRRRGRVGRP